MTDKISALKNRSDYKAGKLVESELSNDPIMQFGRWLDAAMQTSMHEPTAMNLATCSSEGILSSRMVLLKGVDERGFVFFTNYKSRKAADIEASSQAALCFWWGELERQIRIEGEVEFVSEEESDEYFRTRQRGSQIGAIASHQRHPQRSGSADRPRCVGLEADHGRGSQCSDQECCSGTVCRDHRVQHRSHRFLGCHRIFTVGQF